jgi:hypothetical protein
MVVVEHANNQIGRIAEIEFVRSLQTAAGKMMFAKLTSPASNVSTSNTLANKPNSANKRHYPKRQPNSHAGNFNRNNRQQKPNKEQDLINLVNKQS